MGDRLANSGVSSDAAASCSQLSTLLGNEASNSAVINCKKSTTDLPAQRTSRSVINDENENVLLII